MARPGDRRTCSERAGDLGLPEIAPGQSVDDRYPRSVQAWRGPMDRCYNSPLAESLPLTASLRYRWRAVPGDSPVAFESSTVCGVMASAASPEVSFFYSVRREWPGPIFSPD